MLEGFIRYLQDRGYSDNTVDRYRRALSVLFAEVDQDDLSADVMLTWLRQKKHWGYSSKSLALNAARAYMKWRYGEQHPLTGCKIRKTKSPPQRSLSFEATQQLLATFDTHTPKGIRDLALAGILLDTGLRCAEVCRLELERVSYDRKFNVHYLMVIVKGGHWDSRSYSDYTARWLDEWLNVRKSVVAHLERDHGRVFCSVGGLMPGHPLTRHGLQRIVRDWGVKIGEKLSPHMFRRTMASLATLMGAPESVAMTMGGWKSSEVFRGYLVGVKLANIQGYSVIKGLMER